MGLLLECEWCGSNPLEETIYECICCGQEFCSECVKEETGSKYCKKCREFICSECVAGKRACTNCGQEC